MPRFFSSSDVISARNRSPFLNSKVVGAGVGPDLSLVGKRTPATRSGWKSISWPLGIRQPSGPFCATRRHEQYSAEFVAILENQQIPWRWGSPRGQALTICSASIVNDVLGVTAPRHCTRPSSMRRSFRLTRPPFSEN